MKALRNKKALSDQVIVITGASSGIGLATAREAASEGAKLVLAARSLSELEDICHSIVKGGGQAIAVGCDVADADQVQKVADRAVAEFGGIDTWINNAGSSIYGKLTEVPLAEKRQLFDVNFWGVVHGCRSAVRAMRERGGTIINIGSVLSDRAVPIQGIYSASKHAVKGYTDALRMELEAEGYPIAVTLVKPGAIDTPYPQHAINHLGHAPSHSGPVYAPEVVAKAILEAATHPRRDVYVGGSAKLLSLLETFVPRLTDLAMERTMMDDSMAAEEMGMAAAPTSMEKGRVRGQHPPKRVRRHSAYTAASLHPGVATLMAAGLGLATAAGIGFWQSRRGPKPPAETVQFH